MGSASGLRRLGRKAPSALAVLGFLLAGVAIAGDWGGFGWISGPAAIAAVAVVPLVFLVANLPTATESDDWTNTPNVSGNTDGE